MVTSFAGCMVRLLATDEVQLFTDSGNRNQSVNVAAVTNDGSFTYNIVL